MSRTYRAVSNRQARRAGITPLGSVAPVSRETQAHATPATAVAETGDQLEISYRELQAQAKARDIPANQSREELEAALGYD